MDHVDNAERQIKVGLSGESSSTEVNSIVLQSQFFVSLHCSETEQDMQAYLHFRNFKHSKYLANSFRSL